MSHLQWSLNYKIVLFSKLHSYDYTNCEALKYLFLNVKEDTSKYKINFPAHKLNIQRQIILRLKHAQGYLSSRNQAV